MHHLAVSIDGDAELRRRTGDAGDRELRVDELPVPLSSGLRGVLGDEDIAPDVARDAQQRRAASDVRRAADRIEPAAVVRVRAAERTGSTSSNRWTAPATAGSARQAASTATSASTRSGRIGFELIDSKKWVVLAAELKDSAAKRAELSPPDVVRWLRLDWELKPFRALQGCASLVGPGVKRRQPDRHGGRVGGVDQLVQRSPQRLSRAAPACSRASVR